MEGVKGGQESGGFVAPWMAIAAEARQQTLEMYAGESMDTQSRVCEQAVLQLHGWYFDIERGELLACNPVLSCLEVKN